MSDDISVKNTKNEILEAYHEALKQLKESKKMSRQEEKIQEERKEIIANASEQTTDIIVKGLAELKLSIVRSLEELEEKLLSSQKRLLSLQQAIEFQTTELSELHEIKVNTDTLAALLAAQKARKEAFEAEITEKRAILEQDMTEKRAAWKKEQEEQFSIQKEQELLLKKTRQREEEEYLYQRDITRQKEKDAYEAQKQALEKELIDKRLALEIEFKAREAHIIENEQTLSQLHERTEKFPQELQKAIDDTEKAVMDRLSFKYDYEAKLMQKEVEGERKLYQQMIAALEAKVKHLEEQAHQAAEKANQANLQVQDIAVKAIEGASYQRYSTSYIDKQTETTTKM